MDQFNVPSTDINSIRLSLVPRLLKELGNEATLVLVIPRHLGTRLHTAAYEVCSLSP